MIKIEGISKFFINNGRKVQVLKDLNLEIIDGAFQVIYGPSGIGKTTLLFIIAGMDYPSGGKVLLDNTDIFALEPDELSKIRNKKIGFIFQSFNLLPYLSAMDNIMLPAYFSPDKDKRKDMISGYAKQLGIKERLNHRPQELSAGEQQRVAVLRSIVNEPSVLIADEPTADLDNPTSEKILEILKDLNRAKKCTVILATNDANIAARFPLKFNLP